MSPAVPDFSKFADQAPLEVSQVSSEDRVPLVPHDRQQRMGIPVDTVRANPSPVFPKASRDSANPLVLMNLAQLPLHIGGQPLGEEIHCCCDLCSIPDHSEPVFSALPELMSLLDDELKVLPALMVRHTARRFDDFPRTTKSHPSSIIETFSNWNSASSSWIHGILQEKFRLILKIAEATRLLKSLQWISLDPTLAATGFRALHAFHLHTLIHVRVRLSPLLDSAARAG